MKILGLLLILGALVGGGIILSDTIPGYFRNKDHVVRAQGEAEAAQVRLKSVGANANATEAEINNALHRAESATSSLRFAHEGVERRRNETLLFGGGALAVLALGTFLFFRGRRKSAAGAGPVGAIAAA